MILPAAWASLLIPVVYYGAENYKENLSRLKHTDFHLRVGGPFHLDAHGEKVTRQIREKMMQEMMYQMASLLAPHYRGAYAGTSAASTRYIDF